MTRYNFKKRESKPASTKPRQARLVGRGGPASPCLSMRDYHKLLSMKATAIANVNIALVKYWGKRDEKLILPQNASLSMTCRGLFTKTTVEFSDNYKKDIIVINGQKLKNSGKNISMHLAKIKKVAKKTTKAKIVSQSNFPVAAGLASSASGLAALTLATTTAIGLKLTKKELSILARQGSGSACRSIFGGFVQWRRGEKKDGSDSYAQQIVNENYWPELRMIVAIVSEEKKKTASRAGMAQTIKTCPYYKCWLQAAEKDLKIIKKGILKKDFNLVGRQAEHNCLKMHALMITTSPSIIYWTPLTVEILQNIFYWREQGLKCYFTMDAGPQVKIICLVKDVLKIKNNLKKIKGLKKIIISGPGQGARLTNKHLF